MKLIPAKEFSSKRQETTSKGVFLQDEEALKAEPSRAITYNESSSLQDYHSPAHRFQFSFSTKCKQNQKIFSCNSNSLLCRIKRGKIRIRKELLYRY
jgi:hypothetical protein